MLDLQLSTSTSPANRDRCLPASRFPPIAVEHLLDAYGKDVDRRIDIEVDFAAEALSLTVRGPELPSSEINSTLASIRARVEFLRGR